jgi:hypothetical protein
LQFEKKSIKAARREHMVLESNPKEQQEDGEIKAEFS